MKVLRMLNPLTPPGQRVLSRAGSQAPPWPRSELYFIRSEFFGMILRVSKLCAVRHNEGVHSKKQPHVSRL